MAYVVTILGLGAAILIIHKLSMRKQAAPFPPGPPGWPILGNLFDMPSEKEWFTYEKWGKIWGDLVSVSILGQRLIIVNSAEVALDMLEKKGTIYSDRPVAQMAGELVGWGKTTPFLSYGEPLKNHRKNFHRIFGSNTTIAQFYPIEEIETHKFLKRLLLSPQDLAQHIRHTAGAIILRITYGYEAEGTDDPLVALAERVLGQFLLAAAPGGFLVNMIPPLKRIPDWFPGAGFKKTAREWAEGLHEMMDRPHQYVKDQIAIGSAMPSFTSGLLADTGMNPEKENDIKLSAISLYAGGADTTVSAIYAFFKAMILYPEVVAAAQAELDSVVGPDRLPSFADREHLPYINALVLEVIRWHTVGPLSLPHVVKEDDIHNGYLIPKGAMIIPNVWKMLHDPTVYSDPMIFNPKRFLGPRPEPDPRKVFFGFGRRLCPGRLLAEASMFISCAMTLAVFDISVFINKSGEVIHPVVDHITGVVSHPSPFLCQVKPRSPNALSLINAEVESL